MGNELDLRDIKPIVEVPLGPSWLTVGLVAGGVLLLVLFLALLWWRRRRHKRLQTEPAQPPDAIALSLLRALSSRLAEDEEALRRVYFEASMILRTYLEARFAINATDLTTEEIVSELLEKGALPQEPKAQLRTFLLATDAVKFAKQRATADDAKALIDAATGVVVATRPHHAAIEAA